MKSSSLTYLLTPWSSPSWEANRFSGSQEIPRILWNQKFHYHSHKSPPPVPILRKLNPVHAPTSLFLKIHFNIILPSTPGSPKWSPSLRFPPKPRIRLSRPPYRYMSHQSHFSQLLGEEYRLLAHYAFFSPVTSSPLAPNILHNTLLSNTLSLRSSLKSAHHYLVENCASSSTHISQGYQDGF